MYQENDVKISVITVINTTGICFYTVYTKLFIALTIKLKFSS